MFNFTQQERRVILFLAGMALLGLGIKSAAKAYPCVSKFIQVDNAVYKININKAGLEEFSGVAAITPKLAKDIIEYRNAKGRFGDIEELKEVRGIGERRYEKLKDLFFIE